MYVPPIDPRDRSATKQPTWRNVLAAYALLAAIGLSLWAVSNPVAGAGVIVAIAGISLGARRVVELVRCLRECREFAFDFVGDVRVTVTTGIQETDVPDDDSTETARAPNCC